MIGLEAKVLRIRLMFDQVGSITNNNIQIHAQAKTLFSVQPKISIVMKYDSISIIIVI